MKRKYCEGGEIFCIPLFFDTGEQYNSKQKLRKEDANKNFAFGRVIEQGGSILVEIFKITGTLSLNLEEITSSDLLFAPIQIFLTGVLKKRWKVIGKTENYDKYKDSNYSNINIVLGGYDNLRLYNFESNAERKITKEEARKYEMAIVWHPAQLEPRIIEELNGKKYIHLDTLNLP